MSRENRSLSSRLVQQAAQARRVRAKEAARRRKAEIDAVDALYRERYGVAASAAAASADPAVCIYFIAADVPIMPIKIGMTGGSPLKRLGELDTASPLPLRLLGAMAGAASLEKRLHSRFAHARMRREWFSPVADLLDFIRENTIPPGPAMESDLSRAIERESRRLQFEAAERVYPAEVEINGIPVRYFPPISGRSNTARFG